MRVPVPFPRGLFPLLILLASGATLCCLPLVLHRSLPLSHDIVFHLFLVEEYRRNLEAGVFFPHWAQGAVGGYGSPIFNFYPPLAYLLASLLRFIPFDLVTAVAVTVWLSFFFSGVATYFLVREAVSREVAPVAALLYLLLPFHTAELYLRGSFAGLFAYVWYPLVLLCLLRLWQKRGTGRDVCLLALSFAALIMTHVVSVFMMGLMGAALLLVLALRKEWSAAVGGAAGMAWGMALSAIFLVPAILERPFVHISYLVDGPIGRFGEEYLFQGISALSSPFGRFLHLAVLLEVAVVLLGYRRRGGAGGRRFKAFSLFATMFAVLVILTTPLSRPLVALLPVLNYLQFPWRWLAPAESLLAVLMAGVLMVPCSPGWKRALPFLPLLLLSLLVIGAVPMLRQPFLQRIARAGELVSITDPVVEYIPAAVTQWRDLPPPEIEVREGWGSCKVLRWLPEVRVVETVAAAPLRLRLPLFYYPGWSARIQDRALPLHVEAGSGMVLVDVPPGRNLLTVVFEETALRRAARWLSFLSLLPMGLWWMGGAACAHRFRKWRTGL